MAMDRDKWRVITGAVKAGTRLWNHTKKTTKTKTKEREE
jgi:hypothetical protein